jgi:hypothetical protein
MVLKPRCDIPLRPVAPPQTSLASSIVILGGVAVYCHVNLSMSSQRTTYYRARNAGHGPTTHLGQPIRDRSAGVPGTENENIRLLGQLLCGLMVPER